MLKAKSLCALCPELQGICYLSLVHPVEEVTVVNEEARESTPFGAHFRQHEVETEYLHRGDAAAALCVDVNF